MDEFRNESTMGFDSLADVPNFGFRSNEDYVDMEIKANNKIAERHGGIDKVFVGTILGRREVFGELCVYATCHIPVKTPAFTGTQQVEGHIKLSNLTEFAAVAKLLNQGKTLVIDKATKEIIEVCTW